MISCWLSLCLLLWSWREGVRLAGAEIQDMNITLVPDETIIHYYDAFLRGPGYVDLSDLKFITTSPHRDRRRLDGGAETDGTTVDVVVFEVPGWCVDGDCDYTLQGLGNRTSDGKTLRWCCSDDAIQLGLCDGITQKYGRLIINRLLFTGEERSINVPLSGPMSKTIRFGKLEMQATGRYVAVFANCDMTGRDVIVQGKMVWKSDHGYLPGELFGIMYFYEFLTVVYFIMLFWYGILMHVNADSRIPVEKWILVTILLGLLEMFLQTVDFLAWNMDGYQKNLIWYIALIAGDLKQGISRCLAVMVSLGWGVVRDSLGSNMPIIIILGTTYTALEVAADMLYAFDVGDVRSLSQFEEKAIFDVVTILEFVCGTIDVIFFIWILDALNNTVAYLANTNQSRKLQRFVQLRRIFRCSIIFACIWAVAVLINSYGDLGILQEEHAGVVEAFKETIFVSVLLGVAILWRPNPSAKEYAFVMELQALGADDGEHEIELRDNVPSARDDDEYDDRITGRRPGNGDGWFNVDKAEGI